MIEIFETALGRFVLLNKQTGRFVRRRSGQVVSFKYGTDAQARADQMNEDQ